MNRPRGLECRVLPPFALKIPWGQASRGIACATCGEVVTRLGRWRFCGNECVEIQRLAIDPQYRKSRVWDRDQGVCGACGFDVVEQRRALLHRVHEGLAGRGLVGPHDVVVFQPVVSRAGVAKRVLGIARNGRVDRPAQVDEDARGAFYDDVRRQGLVRWIDELVSGPVAFIEGSIPLPWTHGLDAALRVLVTRCPACRTRTRPEPAAWRERRERVAASKRSMPNDESTTEHDVDESDDRDER